MIRSMTGFGAGRARERDEDILVEIRSVNSKFCEVKVRMPRELLALESDLVRQVKARVARGGIDVFARRSVVGSSALVPRVDAALAREYYAAFTEMARQLGTGAQVELAHLIAAEGVVAVEERAVDESAARKAFAEAAAKALDELVAMREREGGTLAEDVARRLHHIRELCAKLSHLAPTVVEAYRKRLSGRITELMQGQPVDQVRIAQEVAMFADRSDVAEEATRLCSHIAQFERLFDSAEPAGRRMDFLVQEMHRESNTFGAKSQSAEIAELVVELKAEIERIREQVQNIE